MDAELVLDRMRAHVVAFAERAVRVDQEFRHQEQRDALGAGRCIGQPRQDEVHDVVGEVVLAIGDEDLLPGDLVGAIVAFGAGAKEAHVGAGLRLGELHGPGPFAGDELAEIDALELIRPVGREGVDPGHGQRRPDHEGGGGRVPHLDTGGVHRPGQPLAAPFGRAGEPVPAGAGPGGVGLFPAGRHGDGAVLEDRTALIADPVERRDDVAGELAGFAEHGLEQVVAEVIIDALGLRGRKPGGMLQGEGDDVDRSTVHDGLRRRIL